MNFETKSTKRLSSKEKKELFEIVKKYKDILENYELVISGKEKRRAWEDIAKECNAKFRHTRTAKQLQSFYSYTKCAFKRNFKRGDEKHPIFPIIADEIISEQLDDVSSDESSITINDFEGDDESEMSSFTQDSEKSPDRNGIDDGQQNFKRPIMNDMPSTTSYGITNSNIENCGCHKRANAMLKQFDDVYFNLKKQKMESQIKRINIQAEFYAEKLKLIKLRIQKLDK